MPIYEYQCGKCGHEFEAWQRFSDKPVATCARCGGKVKKLVSHSSFILKGSGWYATDYARGSSGPNGNGKKHSKSKSEEGSSAAAETPEKKSDAGGKCASGDPAKT